MGYRILCHHKSIVISALKSETSKELIPPPGVSHKAFTASLRGEQMYGTKQQHEHADCSSVFSERLTDGFDEQREGGGDSVEMWSGGTKGSMAIVRQISPGSRIS